MKQLKHVIWDFNGTILNDVDLSLDVVNQLLAKQNLPALEKEPYRDNFSFPVQEYYRHLGFDFEKIDFNQVSRDYMKPFKKRLAECPLQPGVIEVIKLFQELGISQYVCSALEQAILDNALRHLGLHSVFQSVHGSKNIYARGKLDVADELTKLFPDVRNNSIFIGDTDHDAETAQYIGCPSYIVGMGHQSVKRLQQFYLNVCADYQELLNMVKKEFYIDNVKILQKLTILGSGSFGTALAQHFSEKMSVALWTNDEKQVHEINNLHTNEHFLKGVKLGNNVVGYLNIQAALEKTDAIIVCLPSQVIRQVLKQNKDEIVKTKAPIVCASKGLEIETQKTLSDVISEVLEVDRKTVYSLSGPTFAREIADQKLTAICLAGANTPFRKTFQEISSTDFFRVYTSDDIKSIEIAGSLKNIIAIASGILSGLEMGYNAQAALITRGLAEITRLAVALGGDPITFLGLAGMGDLVLTCTGHLSRNRTVGYELGLGKKLDQVLSELGHVAEGVYTTKAAYSLAKKLNISMPITEQLYGILFEDVDIRQAIATLMRRSLKDERD